jgi:hypothetical protein
LFDGKFRAGIVVVTALAFILDERFEIRSFELKLATVPTAPVWF